MVKSSSSKKEARREQGMSILKFIAGFLVGLLACGLLLFLISVRSPIQPEPAAAPAAAVEEAPTTTEPTASEVNTSTGATDGSDQSGSDESNQDQNESGTDSETGTNSDQSAAPTQQIERVEAVPLDQPLDDTAPVIKEIETAAIEPEVLVPEEPVQLAPQSDTPLPEPTAPEQNELAAAPDQPIVAPEAEPKPQENVAEAEVEKPKALDSSNFASEGSFGKPASRLPTVGSNGGSRITLSSEAPQEQTQQTFGAFELNSQAFAGRDLPILSVIMVDLGPEGVPRAELLGLEFPATFAVPSNLPGADRATSDYRAAGREVLIMPASDTILTSAGGEAADIVASYTAFLPDALGLIDRSAAELQKDRQAVKTVLAALAETGHALLTYDKGLNSTGREAAKLGVPTAKVFRVLDVDQASAQTILRQLDRAILEANQEGAAIVLAHTYPETLEAIEAWVQGGAASGVDIAPVSVAINTLLN